MAWEKAMECEVVEFSKLKNKEDLAKWQFQRYMEDYLRSIKSVDDNVGKVLDMLKETGLNQNTIVVYMSDQGFYLGEHGLFDKRFMYEESLRTPMMISSPSSKIRLCGGWSNNPDWRKCISRISGEKRILV